MGVWYRCSPRLAIGLHVLLLAWNACIAVALFSMRAKMQATCTHSTARTAGINARQRLVAIWMQSSRREFQSQELYPCQPQGHPDAMNGKGSHLQAGAGAGCTDRQVWRLSSGGRAWHCRPGPQRGDLPAAQVVGAISLLLIMMVAGAQYSILHSRFHEVCQLQKP